MHRALSSSLFSPIVQRLIAREKLPDRLCVTRFLSYWTVNHWNKNQEEGGRETRRNVTKTMGMNHRRRVEKENVCDTRKSHAANEVDARRRDATCEHVFIRFARSPLDSYPSLDIRRYTRKRITRKKNMILRRILWSYSSSLLLFPFELSFRRHFGWRYGNVKNHPSSIFESSSLTF